MVSSYKSTKEYTSLLEELSQNSHISHVIVEKLKDFIWNLTIEDMANSYSKPMLWIGLYIVLASICCILAMLADLLHGLRSRKLWFPCKYFAINAFFLSVMAVAMKLPVDLSAPMPSTVDGVAKLGSMAFMCTMMANLSPCLAAMDTNELLSNITALGVLIITLVVNVCIQMQTGLIGNTKDSPNLEDAYRKVNYKLYEVYDDGIPYITISTIYVSSLLSLLIIHVCSSFAILKSKHIIELKYQQGHETASKHLQQSSGKFLTVKELQQHVSNYWIMAGSGSPQFIIACFVTTTASGVICALTTILHILTMYWAIPFMMKYGYSSDYKWSMMLIVIVQLIGVILGTVAPLSRCFATLSFKMSIKSISNHLKVFKVESYWTHKLSVWKHGTIQIPFRSRKLKVVIKTLRNLILNFFIKIQEGVVVVCKIIGLVPFFFMICILYCLRCWKWLLQAVRSSSGENTENLEHNQYVLQLENEMEIGGKML